MIIDCPDVKSDEYQEPYQALKCAPYFSYSTVLLEMKDFVKDSNAALSGMILFLSIFFLISAVILSVVTEFMFYYCLWLFLSKEK